MTTSPDTSYHNRLHMLAQVIGGVGEVQAGLLGANPLIVFIEFVDSKATKHFAG